MKSLLKAVLVIIILLMVAPTGCFRSEVNPTVLSFTGNITKVSSDSDGIPVFIYL